ncbi:MAG: hypothetical protein H7X97_12270 [Opitutaceae bacterium]|nr:hypothetical protein [Verrucomicrobiales bacterium]
MTKPLALVFYENLLPGSQLVNRLHDLGYRVVTVTSQAELLPAVEREMPMVIVADIALRDGDICQDIVGLRQNPAVQHIPVIGFTSTRNVKLQEAARVAGATLVASDSAILDQFPRLLDQALEVN